MKPRRIILKRADFHHPTAAHYALVARQARLEARLAVWRRRADRLSRVAEAILFGFAIDVAAQVARAAGWGW